MPRTKEQNMSIKNVKKQKIMNVALHLFAEDGFVHTSIDKIASHAGISKGLMYTYFRSKEDLLQQILLTGMETLASDLFLENMSLTDFINSLDELFSRVEQHKVFLKLYTALSVQPGVVKKLWLMSDDHPGLQHIITLFQKMFGERANEELLLLLTISKGYNILALYGNRQNAIPFELLKNTVMNFLKERYSINR